MREEEELARIAKKLDKISARKDSSNTAQALDLLKVLQKMHITLDLISKTRIGLTVNNLRKSINDEDVSNISKSLIKKWKKMLSDKDAHLKTTSPPASKSSMDVSNDNNNLVSNNNNNSDNGQLASSKASNVRNGGAPLDSSSSKSFSPSTTGIDGSGNGAAGRKQSTSSFPARQVTFPKVSHTTDEVRLKCREMLANALKPDANTEGDESDIFFDHVELANAIEEKIFREFKDTNPKYKARIRSRMANLRDTKNPDLKLNVLRGSIKPEKIAVMTAEEMASAEMKQLRQKFTKEAINDAQMSLTGGTKTDLLKCPNCKKSNCTYNQVQTRSADEPMTTFCYCNECGKRWKFC